MNARPPALGALRAALPERAESPPLPGPTHSKQCKVTSTAARSDAKAGIFVSGAGFKGGRLMARLLERGGLQSRANRARRISSRQSKLATA